MKCWLAQTLTYIELVLELSIDSSIVELATLV